MSVWYQTNKGCPCRGCETPIRHEGCHGECEKYILWNNARIEAKTEDLKKMKIENDYHSYKTDRHQKLERRRRNG